MTVFAVWGMTESHARAIAEKKTSNMVGHEVIPESEWLERVVESTETILSGEVVKQLFGRFDTPQFANAFIDLAKRAGRHRDLTIKVWRQLKDDFGKPVFSKNGKKPRMGWADYIPHPNH